MIEENIEDSHVLLHCFSKLCAGFWVMKRKSIHFVVGNAGFTGKDWNCIWSRLIATEKLNGKNYIVSLKLDMAKERGVIAEGKLEKFQKWEKPNWA